MMKWGRRLGWGFVTVRTREGWCGWKSPWWWHDWIWYLLCGHFIGWIGR